MRLVIQRVKEASVTVDNDLVSKIDNGILVLVGYKNDDCSDELENKLIDKLLKLRIFSDSEGKMNLDLFQVNGSILFVSQFTLYANLEHTNRPSFTEALNYKDAEIRFNNFVEKVKNKLKELNKETKVYTGVFGADMQVSLINDGPVTILLEN